jgi:hypothetical protein
MPILLPSAHLAASAVFVKPRLPLPALQAAASAASSLGLLALSYLTCAIFLPAVASLLGSLLPSSLRFAFDPRPASRRPQRAPATPMSAPESLRRHVYIDAFCPVVAHTPRERAESTATRMALPPAVGTPCALCSGFASEELIKHGHLKRTLPCRCEFHALCIDMFLLAETAAGSCVHDFRCPTCMSPVLRSAIVHNDRYTKINACRSRSRTHVA